MAMTVEQRTLARGRAPRPTSFRCPSRSDAVDPRRVAAEYRLALDLGKLLEQLPDGGQPVSEAAGQVHDGPVAAVKDTLGAEDRDCVLDIGPEIAGRPPVAIRLVREPRELAGDVRPAGELSDVLRPGLELAGPDRRLAEV